MTVFSKVGYAALGENVIPDSGLELGGKGWTLRNGSIDALHANSGIRSVRLDGDKNNTWNITQTGYLDVVGGEKYLLGVWCKARGEGTVSIGLRASDDANNTIVYDWHTIPISKQNEWFYFSKEIRASSNPLATRFEVFCWVRTSFEGSIWFDDFSLQIIDIIPPNEPTDLTAKRKGESIILSWRAPQKAEDGDIAQQGYNVYRSNAPISTKDEGELVASGVKQTSWEDTQITRGKHYYIVTALDKVGNESKESIPLEVLGAGSLTGKVRNELGEPLEGVLVSALDDGFEVLTNSAGEYYFQTLFEGIQRVRVVKPGYPWIDEDVEIKAGEVIYQDFKMISDAAKPPAIEIVQISNATAGMLTLSWEAPANIGNKNIAGYNIYRSEAPNFSAQPQQLVKELVDGLTWSDVKVIPDKKYWYAISVVDTAFNESLLSHEVEGIAFAPPRPTLTSPAQSVKIIDQPIEFQWSELSDVDYYNLEISRDESFSKEIVLIPNLETNSYLYKRTIRYQEGSSKKVAEIGLPDGQWFWRVQAFYTNGVVSAPSDPLSLYSINTKLWVDDEMPGEIDVGKKTTGLGSLEIPFFQVFPAVLTAQAPTIEFVFHINFAEPVEGELLIIDPAGKVVASLYKGVFVPEQLYTIPWQGLDSKQQQVRNGLYIAQIRIHSATQKKVSNIKFLVFN